MKMTKKAALLFLALTLAFTLALPGAALNETRTAAITFRQIHIIVKGTEITPVGGAGTPVEPFIMNGSTYLPLRAAASALGAGVSWDGASSTVALTTGKAVDYGSGAPIYTSAVKNVRITYRSIKITVDGKAVTPVDGAGRTAEPFIMDGTTYVPLGALAKLLGTKVAWNGATNTVTLGGTQKSVWRIVRSTTEKYSAGQLSAEITADYTYDADGRCIEIAEPTVTHTRTYNSLGQVASLTDAYKTSGSVTTDYTYNSAGRLTKSVEKHSDVYEIKEFTYDSRGHVLTVRTYSTTPSGAPQGYGSNISYKNTYDSAGRLSKRSYSDYTEYYSYDSQGRLVKLHTSCADPYGGLQAADCGTIHYEYDADGNRVREWRNYGDGNDQISYTTDFTYELATIWS